MAILTDCYTPRAGSVLDSVVSRAAAEGRTATAADVIIATVDFDKCVAGAVIRRLGINVEELKATVRGPVDPSVEALLRLAQGEMRRLNHTYLGTEHLFLAGCVMLLRSTNPAAAELNFDIRVLRAEVLKELDPNFSGEGHTGH